MTGRGEPLHYLHSQLTGYYDRGGAPMEAEDYIKILLSQIQYQWIAFSRFGPWKVSTIWVGHALQFSETGKPLIYETLAFQGYKVLGEYLRRYDDIDYARRGHDLIKECLISELNARGQRFVLPELAPRPFPTDD